MTLVSTALLELRRNVHLTRHLIGTSQNIVKRGIRPATSPFQRTPSPTPVEELVTINQKLAASLERQSLPKCHPEIFAGDVTLFHPWKSAFRAMIKDANLSPEKEINYLRSYTKGDAQKVVNNFRQRQYRDPVVTL